MNTENRYPVTASLFMLREMKRRQEQVHKGYQLLKRKAEALRYKGRQTASELSHTQSLLGHTLREAYISLAAIKFTNGESNALVLENIGLAQLRVQRTNENISGVSTVCLEAIEDPSSPDALKYAGLASGGHRTVEAKRAFRNALHLLIKFASLRNTCVLLDIAMRSTLRKVNSIEKIIMPKLRNTEKYILTEMDEREREEFHRLKMVKAKKMRAQVMASKRPDSGDKTSKSESNEVLSTLYCMPCILYPRTNTSSEADSGDKPICFPHNWDDEDLLF